MIDNAEDVYIFMPMYNLLEYSQNYSMAPRRLLNYYRDKIDGGDDNASDGKLFKCENIKTEIKLSRPAFP